MTHTERMAEIKAREAAATQGPWLYLSGCAYTPDGPEPEHPDYLQSEDGTWNISIEGLPYCGTCPNLTFITESRQDIPYLLARLEALEALVEAAYCEGYEDSKDHGSHWSNSVSRAALEGEDNG